ncbi:hypothetical protein [Desulfosporosinus fructosivorans]
MDDEQFLSKWKIIHEKTIAKYVLLESLIYFFCMALVTIMIVWIYPGMSIHNRTIDNNGIYFVIALNTMTFIIFTAIRLISWFKGEKRYRELLDKDS